MECWQLWLKRTSDGKWVWYGANHEGEWETVPFETIDEAVKAYKINRAEWEK